MIDKRPKKAITQGKLVVPVDFEFNGWSKANNYGLVESDFPDKVSYTKARFGRALKVCAAYRKTDAAREIAREVGYELWEKRRAAATKESDTTEILLLEKLVTREDGFTTSELVAGCINMIARELAKRGVKNVEELELKDLVLISNTLLGLTKAAAAVKKEAGPKIQVNNVNVTTSSKTGGVVGGLRDVIDIRGGDGRAVRAS